MIEDPRIRSIAGAREPYEARHPHEKVDALHPLAFFILICRSAPQPPIAILIRPRRALPVSGCRQRAVLDRSNVFAEGVVYAIEYVTHRKVRPIRRADADLPWYVWSSDCDRADRLGES